jgi:hypothetical protein
MLMCLLFFDSRIADFSNVVFHHCVLLGRMNDKLHPLCVAARFHERKSNVPPSPPLDDDPTKNRLELRKCEIATCELEVAAKVVVGQSFAKVVSSQG